MIGAERSIPSESAINRLITTDKSAERQAQARRLGQVVLRHINFANQDPIMRYPGSGADEEHVASGNEYRVGKHVGAWLNFVVNAQFENLQETPEWLPHAERVDLKLRIYDLELPDELDSDIPDATSEVVVSLAPTEETVDRSADQSYAARYQGGDTLDAQDTETVIRILALMADKIEGASSEP